MTVNEMMDNVIRQLCFVRIVSQESSLMKS